MEHLEERPRDEGRTLGEFAFQVVCARARRGFSPLDRDTLRGILTRCGLRVRDLRGLARYPVALVNENEGSEQEIERFSAIFSQAVIEQAASIEPGRGRDAFVRRMADIIAQLHQHTPYRFAGDEPSQHVQLARRIMVNAGLQPGPVQALEALEEALSAVIQPAAPEAVVVPTPTAPSVEQLRSRPVLFKLRPAPPQRLAAAQLILEQSLPALGAAPRLPISPLPEAVVPALSRPDAHWHLYIEPAVLPMPQLEESKAPSLLRSPPWPRRAPKTPPAPTVRLVPEPEPPSEPTTEFEAMPDSGMDAIEAELITQIMSSLEPASPTAPLEPTPQQEPVVPPWAVPVAESPFEDEPEVIDLAQEPVIEVPVFAEPELDDEITMVAPIPSFEPPSEPLPEPSVALSELFPRGQLEHPPEEPPQGFVRRAPEPVPEPEFEPFFEPEPPRTEPIKAPAAPTVVDAPAIVAPQTPEDFAELVPVEPWVRTLGFALTSLGAFCGGGFFLAGLYYRITFMALLIGPALIMAGLLADAMLHIWAQRRQNH